jgi:hypothetical protein
VTTPSDTRPFWLAATAVFLLLGGALAWVVRRDLQRNPAAAKDQRFWARRSGREVVEAVSLLLGLAALFWWTRRPLLVSELQVLGLALLDWRSARRREREWVPRRETRRQYWTAWARHAASAYVPMAILLVPIFLLLPWLLELP